MDRRRFLKYAGATAAVVGASALGLGYFASLPNPKTVDTTSSTASSQITQSSSTLSNFPTAVKEFKDQVTRCFNDLADLADGRTDPLSLKNGSDVYQRLKVHAENLRTSLKDYKPQNSESEGQARRLDQIALGALYLYSWTSRMLEDDLNVARNVHVGSFRGSDKTSSIGTNLSVVRYPIGELAEQLHEELYPDADYLKNVGQTFTDIENEHLISPKNRFQLQIMRNSTSGSRLKQMIEGYISRADSITDYKDTTEEDLALVSLNALLQMTDDSNRDYVRVSMENSLERNSSLGQAADRGLTLIVEKIIALQNGYSHHIDSAYSELPSNHNELSEYDFALALMKTRTFLSERKVGYPTSAWDTEFRLERIFYGAASLAGRDVYTLSVHPWGTDESFVDHSASIKQNGKYYVTAVDGGKAAATADQLGPPLLYDMSDRDWGYMGYRKYVFIIVAKHLFGTLNVIPVFVYNPEKGVVTMGS